MIESSNADDLYGCFSTECRNIVKIGRLKSVSVITAIRVMQSTGLVDANLFEIYHLLQRFNPL